MRLKLYLSFSWSLFILSVSFSQNKFSNQSGNWNNAGIWTPNGVPTSTDNVIISNGHTVNISANASCNSLTVGTGGACALRFSGFLARTLNVNSDITVNSSASFLILTNSNTTHSLNLQGNLINNGTFDMAIDGNTRAVVLFNGNGNQSISGPGTTTDFYRIVVDMGTTLNNVLEVLSSSFSATSNFLTLTNGTFKLSTPNAATLVPYTGTGTIPSTAGLWINSANAVVSANAAINLSGQLHISAGNMDIGNANNEDLVSTGGTLIVSGGSLDIAGKYNASNTASTFSMSGGVLTVPNVSASNTGIAPFHLTASGSQFNMTGGLIVIRREGGNGAQDLGFTNTGSTGGTVSGGTLQIGNSTTPTNQTITINSSYPIPNLLVSSANAGARINTNNLNVTGDVAVSSGSLLLNNFGLTLSGNWSNSAGFTPGTGTVTFNSTTAQTIFKSGGETFQHLHFNGSGMKTFLAPVTANGHFSVAAGSSVDVSTSNFSLTLQGNFLNDGAFISQNGLVMMTGTSPQVIGGSSITGFYDLTINNTAGVSLSNPENLTGTLNLNNGTFNLNSQAFTLVSTSSRTARIAQITGSGDITGNVTVQRHAPGGATGWALLGTPLSSAHTYNDWDDDIFISCSNCPDGSAGGFSSIYTYDETLAGTYDNPGAYVPISTINDAILPGKGYWVYLGNGQFTTTDIDLDVTGPVQKFNFSIPLAYTNSGSVVDDGWNLICNPYPSAISWSSLKGSTGSLDNAIYVYNADLNAGSGGFASCVNGISSPAVGSGGIGDNVPMGQGFYVHSTGATALNAQESNKVTADPSFLKPSASQAITPLLRLFLRGANTTEDETVLYFQQNATDLFDSGFDSYKMRGQDPLAPTIALEKGSEVFQINGISPVSGNFTMPLKTLTGYPGTYTLSAFNTNSFPKGACITLYDKFTNTFTDLKTTDYIFTLADSTSVARFDLNIIINPLTISSVIDQPDCHDPDKGKITVTGTNAGPWNYYWKHNGTLVQTSLNKSGADSLINLNSGTIDLEMNTVGSCDHHESSFTINQQIPVTAQFTCSDTIHLNQSSYIQFHNTSVNSVFNSWDFGFNSGMSNAVSPTFNYTAPGTYTVRLACMSSSGCADSTYKQLTVIDNPLGITEQTIAEDLWLMKTLTENKFLLSGNLCETKKLAFKVFDSGGKMIQDYGCINSDRIAIPIEINTPGIYFMHIAGLSEVRIVKLLVN